MLKIRVTFVNNENGVKELEEAKEIISNQFNIINTSKIYNGRGGSLYSNIYFDVDVKK